MKIRTGLILLACSLLLAQEPSRTQAPSGLSNCCSLVEEALADYGRIKPGMKREDVEKYFQRGGGFNSEVTTRYWYRRCHEIQVDIDFKAKRSKADELFSSRDTVEKKSRLFIDYTILD